MLLTSDGNENGGGRHKALFWVLMACKVIKWHPFWAERNVILWVDKVSANTSSFVSSSAWAYI